MSAADREALTTLAEILRTGGGSGWSWSRTPEGATISSPSSRSLRMDGLLVSGKLDAGKGLVSQIGTLARQLNEDDSDVGRDLIEQFPSAAPALLVSSPDDSSSWMVAVRLAEAALVADEQAGSAGDASARRRMPLLHRTRSLLLGGPALVSFPEEGLSRTDPLGPAELGARAQQARENWLIDLLNHEELPALGTWDRGRIDREFRLLLLRPKGRPKGPWVDDPPYVRWVVREAFLPRFMLADAWRALPRPLQGPTLAPLLLLAMTVVACVVGLAGAFPRGLLLPGATIVAGAAYAMIVVVAGWAWETVYLLCLRLPAGAAVGLLAVISFGADWVSTPGTTWALASAVLLLASWAYLFVEALAHGVPCVAAFRRSAVVGALGFAHAMAVATIALPVVGRAFNADFGLELDNLTARGLSQCYLLAASAGLAVGVFLQMLWDDHPVTYPLTHLGWKGRGRG